MITQLSLLRSKPKADVASKFVGVLSRDRDGRPKTLVVPGSGGKQYHVIVRRFPGKRLVTLECNLLTGACGMQPCAGNMHTLCYHTRAAFDFVVAEAGFSTAWCMDEARAKQVAKLHKGSQYYNVRSHQNAVQVCVVVFNKMEK